MSSEQCLSACLAIGPVVLAGRALLAPLSGVTDVHFRRAAMRFGASAVVSEMVAADSLLRGEQEARLRAEGTGIGPHIVQIAGCDPHLMGEGARLAEAGGAAIVDINMGCPAKRVTGGHAGSALMRDLDLSTRILAAVKAAVGVPVTVKMRLGWDAGSLNAPELARRAEGLGLSAVTVHGRTRQQFYAGRADWPAISEVVAAVTIPVTANGDIGGEREARACLAASGAAAVMIGRAALGRPWLVGQVAAGLAGRAAPAPAPAERGACAIAHYEGLLGLYGKEIGLRHARKHLAAYVDRLPEDGLPPLPPGERQELVTTTEPARVAALLTRAFAADPLGMAA